jgi:hypothetical protein
MLPRFFAHSTLASCGVKPSDPKILALARVIPLRIAAHRPLAIVCLRGPTVDESNCRRDPRLRDVCAALLRMDPSDRQAILRPLIALIMRVAADGSGPTSAPGTPANGDLRSHA